MERKYIKAKLLLYLVIALAVTPVGAEELGIDVFSPRPLNLALRILAEQIKCIITYEDPPYLCENDVWLPDDVWFPDDDHVSRTPCGGPLSYSYNTDQVQVRLTPSLDHGPPNLRWILNLLFA